MKRITLAAALAAFALPLLADWNVHVNIGALPFYGYAPADVVYVERYVPARDVPLVFVAARHARVRPVVIVEAYRHGGWGLVCARFGVPRQVLFAPAGPPPVVVYLPYGPPHPKHYRKAFRHDRRGWR
ncbi:MAG: hypothetical protein N2036_03245 [Bryobacteraceae bacterium]|nr:hypothetical protein [Bryobacteraceae bacterium]